MHAIGFGDTANNLDVDLGDNDLAPPASQETALWTYFGSDGEIAITDPRIDRSFYLDDAWHRYSLVRTGNLVTVYLDGAIVGTAAYSGPLGSASASARNFIGRASLLTEVAIIGPPGLFPWFGYISGVRVFDEALPPPTSVPSLAPVAAIALVGLMVGIA